MLRYLAGRLLQAAGVVLAIAAITFFVLNVVPGDPVRVMLGEGASEAAITQVRHEMGLDRSVPAQFLGWLGRLASGDLGTSYARHRPVAELVAAAFGYTAVLASSTFVLSLVLGLLTGITAALFSGRWPDRVLMAVAVAGISAPSFFVAIALQLLFSLRLGLLPLSGATSAASYVLPTLALGTRQAAAVARMTRSALLEVRDADYLRTARAKGRSWRCALLLHGLRNALVPVVTICGSQLADIFAGAVIVESVFGIPGMGTLLVNAINQRDLPLVEGGVMYVALVCAIAYLATDICYALIDPRVRLGQGARR